MHARVEKGDLHLLVPAGDRGSLPHGPGGTLVLYCPQKRRGRLLAVDRLGSPRMCARVLTAPMKYDELLGEVDGRGKAEVTGVYQIAAHGDRISLAYRLDSPDPGSLIPEEASYVAAGGLRHPKAWFVEGREFEFETATDRATPDILAKLRGYGKRRKPRPILVVPLPGHGEDEGPQPAFETVRSTGDDEYPWEVRCYRCDQRCYARRNVLGREVDCPNCLATLTVTNVLERPTTFAGPVELPPGTGGEAGIRPVVVALFRFVFRVLLAPIYLARSLVGWCLGVTFGRPTLIVSATILTIAIILIGMAMRFGRHWAGVYYSLVK